MDQILAEIITIGDEILYGQIIDTNSSWLAQYLDTIGFSVIRKTSVGDNASQILHVLEETLTRASLVITTGGLGPTNDDITKKVFATLTGAAIEPHQEAMEHLQHMFAQRGKELNALNRTQAYLPTSCTYIRNDFGTAPGMAFRHQGTLFICLPGVPSEMKGIMQEQVLSLLCKEFQTPKIKHRIIRTIGIAESNLAEKLENFEQNLGPDLKLAYLPEAGQVKLRLTALGDHQEENSDKIEKAIAEMRQHIDKYIYAYDDEVIEKVIGKLLVANHMHLATAESCTGGHIASRITSIPGSSEYFEGGLVAYSNKVKMQRLGVKAETLQTHGAVSEETVIEMAEGVRKLLGVDISISCSGIAGPGGGTVEKPVGTVWIACADKDGTVTRKLMLGKQREMNIQSTTIAALHLVWQRLIKRIEQ